MEKPAVFVLTKPSKGGQNVDWHKHLKNNESLVAQ